MIKSASQHQLPRASTSLARSTTTAHLEVKFAGIGVEDIDTDRSGEGSLAGERENRRSAAEIERLVQMSRDTLSAMKKRESRTVTMTETNSSKRVLRCCRAGSPDRPDMAKIIALIKRENQRSHLEAMREERRILG